MGKTPNEHPWHPPRQGGAGSIALACRYGDAFFAAKRGVKVFLGSDGACGDGCGVGRPVRTAKPRSSERGVVTGDELNEALRAQNLEALATLLAQQEGELVAEPPPASVSQVLLSGATDTSTMLLEALRRLDEWRRGRVEPEAVLRLVGDPTHHPLSPEAWTVLEAVDGLRRARSVALACDLPKEQVYHLLYELKSRGILAEAEVRPHDPLLLILADSRLVQRLLLVTLERHRYQVTLPPNLEGARRILEHNRVHGILLEGADLASKVHYLRSTPGGRFVPIWLIAQEMPRGLRARSARVACIPRPFGEKDLLEALSGIKRPI